MNLLEILQNLNDTSDITDLSLNELSELVQQNGLDASQFSLEDLEYHLSNINSMEDFNYSLDDFDITLGQGSVLDLQSDFEAIDNNLDIDIDEKTKLLHQTLQEHGESYFNQSDIKTTTDPIVQKIGSNIGNHMQNSNVSFEGNKKFLEMLGHDLTKLPTQYAETLAKSETLQATIQSVEGTLSPNNLQEIFNSFLKVLNIK